MIRFINNKANRILEEEKTRKNEELKQTTIDKTEDLPLSNYKLPEEGTLISTCDTKDIQYIQSDELIDSGINIYYYNSCICKYKDGYRLFYRCGKNPKTCEDRIATCLLTEDLRVVSDTNKYVNVFSNWQASRDCGPDTLDRHIRYYYSDSDSVKSFLYKDGFHVEDPRVVEFMGHWFLFYTDGMTMGVAKLDFDSCDVIYSHFLQVPPKTIINKNSDGREKNWIPVVSGNQLYLLYSDTPRTFIHCRDEGISLNVLSYDKLNYAVLWTYGDIRGGCAPIEYDQNSLIWFFHSSKEIYSSIPVQNSKVYFIGAYLTTKHYPFSVTQITRYPILFGTPSPLRAHRSYQTNVVFPCGAVKCDNYFLISMGINDYCIGHVKVYPDTILWQPFKKHFVSLSLNTLS